MAIPVGRFEGEVVTRWDDDGRTMHLLHPLRYIDSKNKSWDVPVDAVTDGASIPKPFWSLVGGPYSGRYRKAAVVHDHFCMTRTESWEATHQMFHEAMLAAEVSEELALILYQAVLLHGPRWDEQGRNLKVPEFEPWEEW